MNPVISITSADSVTVFVAGKPFTVASDNPRYDELKAAISAGDLDLVDGIVNASTRLTKVLGVYGDVAVFAGHVTFQGRPVKTSLVERLLKMVNQGRDPEPYARFLDRVMRNPTKDAISMLFDWVEKADLPILPDGRFLAYRYVRMDYLDGHTGTMDNTPGRMVRMPREACDENHQNTCSRGLHFCNHTYLKSMSGYRCMIMAEDPSDVVSFPQDGGGSKGRTEKHEVLFEISMEDARNGIFFEGEDKLVFDFDRVEHYQRAQLRFLGNEGTNTSGYFDAYDAGYRVVWREAREDEAAYASDSGMWDTVKPDGTVISGYTTRLGAWECAVEDNDATNPVVGDDAEVAAMDDDATETFSGRLDKLETALGLALLPHTTFSDRLDRIEEELGLDDHTPPQIDRLTRAERAAGL